MVLFDAVIQDGDHHARTRVPFAPGREDVQVWTHVVILQREPGGSMGPAFSSPLNSCFWLAIHTIAI